MARQDLSKQQPTALFIMGAADDCMVRLLPDTVERRRAKKPMREIFGSLSHYERVSIPGLVNEAILLIGPNDQVLNCNIPQVIINCIVDADIVSHTLIKEKKLIELIQAQSKRPIPVINPPDGILKTPRDKIYEQFKDLPGLRVPRVARITPESVADAVKQIKKAGFKFPVLMRAIGTHGGKSLQIIENESPAELLKLERYAYDGSAFYVIEWVDFKSKDGLYRKARLACVGGRLIARHQIVSEGWNVHSQSRKTVMKERPELRKEEEAFLTTPLEKTLSKDARASLKRIYETLGLDYFGIDCSVDTRGDLVIFEINAAVNAMEQKDLDLYPYLSQPVQNIIQAFNDVIASKTALKRAA
jgi:glutathione synthase/RimK-type ligase-like ATP-grasp enzyme